MTSQDIASSTGPTPQNERVDTLDVLRGFALLGILLVNIELFRGPVLFDMLAGREADVSRADETAQFLVGWLASGKFISSFAIMFGIGAAIMYERALARAQKPRRLLARRYTWLLVFGLFHMFLLFPGDILFIYGIAGLLLLLFVRRSVRTALWWSGGLLGVSLLVMLGGTVLGTAAARTAPPEAQAAAEQATEQMEQMFAEISDQLQAAFASGQVGEIAAARAWEVAVVQFGSFFVLPSVLALFLFGFAVGRTGILHQLAQRRRLLRNTSIVGLTAGLLLNVPVGLMGPLGGAAVTPDPDTSLALLAAASVGQILGAPLLAVGYLATLALVCQNPAVLRRLTMLRDTGRMALTGYILQSVLASTFFVWLGYYGALSLVASMAVVVAVWAVVLTFCTAWQRRVGRGPLETLWRRLTYGRVSTR